MSPYLAQNHGLSVASYIGDGAVLLAFDLDEDKTRGLAGFAIKATTPDKGPYASNEYWLKNRLSFRTGLSNKMLLAPDKWVESNKAPFQTFHWIHFPGAGLGQYTYTVFPCYFKDGGALKMGPGVSSNIDLSYRTSPHIELGFTRGAISSQAYADRFKNAGIRPEKKSVDFDTGAYQPQYEWLGAHARKLVFDFLRECQEDPSVSVDAFTYDLDEPDVIREIAVLGSRARVIQDDSSLHKKGDAIELQAVDAFKRAGVTVKTGHFRRYSHDKIFIKKRSGKAVKVLTGSTNFSLRGLYVQANSVLVFDSPEIAGLYEQVFDQAFSDMGNFRSSAMASKWFDVTPDAAPPLSFSFAPHETGFTLDAVADAVDLAKSSVFFAVMQMGKPETGGRALSSLIGLGGRDNIFSLGIVDAKSDLKLFKQGKSNGVTSKSWLRENAPQPFQPELSGLEGDGGFVGHVIHHKFIVCDFNGPDPVVFCGSSNLAPGGETSNGDNLIAIHDPTLAYNYAAEAIRLYDHYRFRSLHEGSTPGRPLELDMTDGWLEPFYDPGNIKFHERKLFSASKAWIHILNA